MIPLFICSKDRPVQLRLLLESISRNCPNLFDITILYAESLYCYTFGYHKLKDENIVNAKWVQEKTEWQYKRVDNGAPMTTMRGSGVFTEQFYDFLFEHEDGHFCLMVDDNIFFRKTECSPEDILSTLDDETFCFTFRLGKNTTTQNHLDGQPQLELEVEKSEKDFIKWDWQKYNNAFTDYAFPFSWDGVVYKTKDILTLLDGTDLDSDKRVHESWKQFPLPHRLESYMGTLSDNRAGLFSKKRLMSSFNHSHLVGMDYNKVIDVSNRGGVKFEAHENDLCTFYILGHHIDYDSMNFQNVKSAHDEIPFKLTE